MVLWLRIYFFKIKNTSIIGISIILAPAISVGYHTTLLLIKVAMSTASVDLLGFELTTSGHKERIPSKKNCKNTKRSNSRLYESAHNVPKNSRKGTPIKRANS